MDLNAFLLLESPLVESMLDIEIKNIKEIILYLNYLHQKNSEAARKISNRSTS